MREKNVFFIILLSVFSFFNCCKNNDTPKNIRNLSNSLNEPSFKGFWGWESNDKSTSFRIKVYQQKDSVWGQYCAAAYSGNRMDCNFDVEYNIHGHIIEDTAKIKFYSFYGAKGGTAILKSIDDNVLLWKIIDWPSGGQVFAPPIAKLYILKEK